MAYPVNVDVFTTKVDGQDDILAAHMNSVQAAIVAVETEIGLGLRGSLTDLATRLAVALNNDGTLKTAQVVPGAGSITHSMIATGAVQSDSIQDGSITGADIAAGTITGTNLANATVGSTQLAGQAVTTAKIATGAVGSAQIATGGVIPDNMGIVAYNATGSTLTAGQLVYISGWNSANGLVQVSLATNNVAAQGAEYVVTSSIANLSSGTIVRHWLSGANLNTGGSTIGNPVYSDSTAGGWTLTAPTAGTSRKQIVGRVVVVDAAVGQVDFDILANHSRVLGTNDLQNNSVGTSQLTTTYGAVRQAIQVGTIAVGAGTTDILGFVPISGTVSAIKFTSIDSLAANDTNYLTIGGIEKGAAGGGVTAMTTLTAVSTTKLTGGQAITAFVPMSLGNAGVAVTAGDIIDWQFVVTGTLANQLRQCIITLTIVPNQ